MDYNKKIKELEQQKENLIKDAIGKGYILLDNGNLTKQDMIPVIEIFSQARTDCESYGHFFFIRKLIPLTNDEYFKFLFLKDDEDYVGMYKLMKVFEDDEKIKALSLFFESVEDIGDEDIEERKEDYYNRDNFILEYAFDKYNIHGYVSLFNMDVKQYNLEKENQYDIYFKKIIKHN